MGPVLASRYRVVSLTRRGHRGSSATTRGHEFARLAQDVGHVMDALGIDRAVVVGSSFAGEEMHVLGARHSARIRGLVYVDAAFDRGDDTDEDVFNAAARRVPSAPGPVSVANVSSPAGPMQHPSIRDSSEDRVHSNVLPLEPRAATRYSLSLGVRRSSAAAAC